MIFPPRLHEFYSSLDDISIVNNNIDKKRDVLRAIIYNFNSNIQSESLDKDLLAKNEALGGLLESTHSTLKSASQQWVAHFEALLHREKFRSDLENHFIVIIFGKVKAGKSSLGNFIANSNTTGEKVSFFKYDEAGNEQAIKELEEIDDDVSEFATDNCECTVEIQGFKLKGLAWVDTPGLGSMVEENGALAKEYIQSADYIIYPTSSGSPLHQDEIGQLQELFAQKKPVTICITKSDTKERKKDANGKYQRDHTGKIAKFTVNKAETNRQEQETYVKGEIAKILTDQSTKIGDVLSISAHTAREALETNDEALLHGSNMLKFYELMTEVVKTKASTLKASTPLNGLLSFIDNKLLAKEEHSSSIKALEASLNAFDIQVKESKEKFEAIKVNTNSDIKSEIDYIVSTYMSEIDKSNSKEKFATIDEKLSQNISEIINKNINEVLYGFSHSLHSLENILGKSDAFEIKDEYREIEVWYEDRSWVNFCTFGALGRSQSSVEETVLVGDNKEKMILTFKENRTAAFVRSAIENYDRVSNSLFVPLSNISKDIKEDIQCLKQDIVDYKESLKG